MSTVVPKPAVVAARVRTWRRTSWLLPPLVTMLLLWIGLGAWSRDWRAPLSYSGDALFYLAHTRATLDHGWWWFNPDLGAPGVYPALIFPQNETVDQAIAWLFRWFTRDASLVVTLLWFTMVGLSAATARWGFRRLGVSPLGAGVAGILFALSPFAMYRNVIHLNLSIYLVPFAATAAVLVASARDDLVWRRRGFGVLLAGHLLLGFDYVYNAFFACVLLAAAIAIGYAARRSRTLLDAGALLLGAVIVASVLNMMPTAVAWRGYGHPTGVEHSAAESEAYGLKVRHLVSPVLNHWFPPFAAWLDREQRADYPLENENTYARLGVVGSIGFLGLLVALVNPRRAAANATGDVTTAAARVTAATLLVATVGGFGSLFSLLVAADIRAWSRMEAFIAFFALTGLALWLDRRTAARRWLHVLVWMVVLLVGVADQYPAVADLAKDGPLIAPEYRKMTAFVSALEGRLPSNALVLQLPMRPFPLDGGTESMGVYDHFRPYLSSRHLRWSYPALSHDQIAWERRLASRPPDEWPDALAADGFAAVLINRWGYADHGDAIASSLEHAPAGAVRLIETDDFIALALRRR